MPMEYETLTDADKLLLARDRLRALESDHYRISLTHEVARESRLAQIEDELETVKTEVARLEASESADEHASEFEKMKVDELKSLAEERGVELKSSAKKAEIIDALVEDEKNVTPEA